MEAVPGAAVAVLSIGLVLSACGDASPFQPSGPEGPTFRPSLPGPPAALRIVSGDGQRGKAGEALAETFVVQVTDTAGRPVPDVRVDFRVTSGAGHFLVEGPTLVEETPVLHPAVSLLTGPDGSTRIRFRPIVLGMTTVVASTWVGAGPVDGSPATFTIEATVLVIEISGEDECWFIPCFRGPTGESDVRVPVGATVEWVNRLPEPVTISSTSSPAEGSPFTSPPLWRGARFRFVPDVAGSWEYADEDGPYTNGTLTAYEEG